MKQAVLSGLSREQRGLGRIKLTQQHEISSSHVTQDSGTTSKVRRSKVNLIDGQKRHSLRPYYAVFCFGLLWHCRHKLGKIAQCLFLRVVVSFSKFGGKLQSLTVFIYTADYGQTSRGGGISCRHAHRLLHCALSCAVYCNRPCLCVCLCACLFLYGSSALLQPARSVCVAS